MRRKAMHEEDAMRLLASSGFVFYQDGDPESGDRWLRIMQQKPDRYGTFRPVDLATLEVFQDRRGNFVVDARALQRVLDVPAELPGDVIPESRLAMGSARPMIAEGWALMDEEEDEDEDLDDEDEDLEDEDDDLDDEDEPGDYSEEFSRMGAR